MKLERLCFAWLLVAACTPAWSQAEQPGQIAFRSIGFLQEDDDDADRADVSDLDDDRDSLGLGDLDLEDIREDTGESRLNQSIYGDVDDRVPQVVDGRLVLPPLTAATTDTSEIGNGRTPEGFRAEQSAAVIDLPHSFLDRGLPGTWTVRHWAAPNTFSLPRFFEDRMLERHGHQRHPRLQPLISGARFFGTVPMLPYLMTVSDPCDCEYTLGYYRSGSCAPVACQRPPYERRAAIAEAVSIASLMALP